MEQNNLLGPQWTNTVPGQPFISVFCQIWKKMIPEQCCLRCILYVKKKVIKDQPPGETYHYLEYCLYTNISVCVCLVLIHHQSGPCPTMIISIGVNTAAFLGNNYKFINSSILGSIYSSDWKGISTLIKLMVFNRVLIIVYKRLYRCVHRSIYSTYLISAYSPVHISAYICFQSSVQSGVYNRVNSIFLVIVYNSV